MPLDGFYPQGEFANLTDQGTVTASSRGTQVTASGSTNTKGSFVQLVASSAVDCAAIMVELGTTNTGTAAIGGVDIAVGGAGSEQVIVNNLVYEGARLAGAGNRTYIFPCSIPAGTRISARSQSSVASDPINVEVQLLPSGMDGAGIIDSIGFLTASSRGTSVDPGTSANTKGSWVQLTASLANDICGFFLCFDGQAQTTSSFSSYEMLDIGIGGAGSEQIIVPNYQIVKSRNSNVMAYQSVSPFIPISIPAVTRIAIRAQSDSTTATSRLFGATLYGVRPAGNYPPGIEFAAASNVGVNTGASTGTSITTGTANNKGAWVQLTASCPIDAVWALIFGMCSTTSGFEQAFDFGIGGAGSEVAIISNFQTEANGYAPTACQLIPVCIPAGTRIAARAQSTAASDTPQAMMILFGSAEARQERCGMVDTYGFTSGSSIGTAVDPGGTGNTKGSWAQLSASIANDIIGLFAQFDDRNQTVSGSAAFAELLDIGIGGAGSEKVIIPNVSITKIRNTNFVAVSANNLPFVPVKIPAGTRLAARAQSSGTTATTRIVGVTAYGVRQ